jgi:tetratricopeptide (TPR) repeat protein
LAAVVLAGLSMIAWRARRTRPWLLVGWLWYLVMLTPMIGIVQMGVFAHADRNTYLSQIGLYAALTWLAAQWRISRLAQAGLASGVLAVLMFCAWEQTACWENSETLWAKTIACTKDNEMAHNNLGNILYQEGILDEAITHFKQALRLNPENATAHFNLASALRQTGRMAEAISHLQKAVQIKPHDPEIQNELAWLLATCPQTTLRNGNQAVALARQANAFTKGGNPIVLRTLAAALAQAGQFRDALQTGQRAWQLAQAQSNTVLASHLQFDLRLYQSGRPFN